MSLAEDLRRPLLPEFGHDSPPRAVPHRSALGVPRVIASTPKVVARQDAVPDSVALPEDSLDMLDRAAKSIVFLLGRYRQLEDHVRQLDAWSKAQIQAAEAAATRWQDVAAEAERKMQDMKRGMEAATKRAEVAEQAILQDQRALSVLQERIIAAFGFGSEAHDALNALDMD